MAHLSAAEEARAKLIEDFHSVIADTEQLMKSVTGEGGGGDRISALRARIGQNLKDAEGRLQNFEESMAGKTRVAARTTDQYVHENPWRIIGMAAGLGVVIGLLMNHHR